jgi:hypothetical protein
LDLQWLCQEKAPAHQDHHIPGIWLLHASASVLAHALRGNGLHFSPVSPGKEDTCTFFCLDKTDCYTYYAVSEDMAKQKISPNVEKRISHIFLTFLYELMKMDVFLHQVVRKLSVVIRKLKTFSEQFNTSSQRK